jgi:HD superfamily phosphohydrolase
MFELLDEKLFKDVIHGYIRVPRCFVENIIDTAMFQRLRNIEQTGMRVLYPDAKHDRFGHSLGVFHLGTQAVDALFNNFLKSSDDIGKSKYRFVKDKNFWVKNKVLFLIACLLHDIGHAPFSHSLENEMHSNSGGRQLDEELAKLLNVKYGELAKQNSASHEKMGAYIIIKHFKTPIEKILTHLHNEKFLKHHTTVADADIDKDIEFVARMVLGLKYEDYQPENQIKNCFIELLNGNNFDVDKLDYIMRDTEVSGIKNTSIDAERLLGAVDIVTLTEFNDGIAGQKGGISESFDERTLIQTLKSSAKNAQLEIKGFIDGTIIIKKDADVKIKNNSIIRELRKFGDEDAKIKINAANPPIKFCGIDTHSNVNFSGDDNLMMYKDTAGVLSLNKGMDSTTCFIQNTKIENEFSFGVLRGEFALTIKGYCDIEIKCNFDNKSPLIVNKSEGKALGEIKGTGLHITVVEDRVKGKPRKYKYNSFAIGFKKSAIGNISAVLDARDNLYKWIYAHHKVMYYANFLIPAIAQGTCAIESRLKCPIVDHATNKINEIDVDDAFVWAEIKKRYRSKPQEETMDRLVYELMNRKYKKTLFKSLPEYDVLFEKLTLEQKRKMNEKFRSDVGSKCESSLRVTSSKYLSDAGNVLEEPECNYLAGFVSEELIREILKDNAGIVSNLVWLSAQYKEKRLSLKSTYLIYKDVTTTLSRIDLLNSSIAMPSSDTSHYFYLYFDVKDENENETRRKLSNAIASWGESL